MKGLGLDLITHALALVVRVFVRRDVEIQRQGMVKVLMKGEGKIRFTFLSELKSFKGTLCIALSSSPQNTARITWFGSGAFLL